MPKNKAMLLGDVHVKPALFKGLDPIFKRFKSKTFLAQNDRQKGLEICQTLCKLIKKEKAPCFLLPAVLEFVRRVEEERILERYTFNTFELWLNQYSGLSGEENYELRSKIAGKKIERSDYQVLFPIGMGKMYQGTHIVTAHKSPDLDTTIASFWGWLDAFAARVSDGLHLWNVPGGPPASQIEIDWLFRDAIDLGIFSSLAKTRTALTLTGHDLMTQKDLMRVLPEGSIASIDHERDQKAVVIVDQDGAYLGDWRNVDVEGVRQVIILLSSCIRWFENALHLQLISLFAKKKLLFSDIASKLHDLFDLKIGSCEPASAFSSKQDQQISYFISKVVGIKEGKMASFDRLLSALASWSKTPFANCEKMLSSMKSLFNSKGEITEDRPQIFHFLEGAVSVLHEAIFQIRERMEKLDVALKTKVEVFGHNPTFVTVRSDLEEIRTKIGSYLSLTVAYPDSGKLFPVGVISAAALRRPFLGTVSLRDFCNREEMTIPPYFEVISVIDHHKSQLNTFSAPLALIADVQSSNTLVAKCAFQINDRYTFGNQTQEEIDRQIGKLAKAKNREGMRLLQRLFKKKEASSAKEGCFIHPDREMLEYFHFLYAILDDTDLLTKVSAEDVECVVSLLNRLKSLASSEEMEILSLEDLPRDASFPKKAAQRILQNDEMYSLYKKVYLYRETEIEKNLGLCSQGEPSTVFADTKEQNGCCRVGQTKLFASNFPFFAKHADGIRRAFLKKAEEVHQDKKEIDLHLHMISTIVSAEEVYQGKATTHPHQDELWIWVPQEEVAVEHLKRFLSAFQSSPSLQQDLAAKTMEVEFLGQNGEELSLVFQESFFSIPHRFSNRNLPLAVFRFRAGALNSRKAMVSPFLPLLA